MHIKHITGLCTVEEVEEASATISSDLHGTYRAMIQLVHDPKIDTMNFPFLLRN